MPGPSDGGVNKEMMSFIRCSPVTPSVSSEFESEAGLTGWIGVSRFGYAVLFSKNVKQRCKRIFCIVLVRLTK